MAHYPPSSLQSSAVDTLPATHVSNRTLDPVPSYLPVPSVRATPMPVVPLSPAT